MSAIGKLVEYLHLVGRPKTPYGGSPTPLEPTTDLVNTEVQPRMRPRIAPGQPVQEVNPQEATQIGNDVRAGRGRPPAISPTDDMALKVDPMYADTQSAMAVPPIQDRINQIESKDYGRYKNADGSVEYGKDRSRHWTTKQKIGSTLLGVLQGSPGGPIGMLAGGLNAGMDRDYLQKREDQKQLQNLIPKLKYQQQQETYNQEKQKRDLQNQYFAVRPDIAQQNADATTQKAATAADKVALDAEYRSNMISLGKQKADDIKAYREQIVDLKKQGVTQTDTRIKLLEKRINETARHNQATESNQRASVGAANSRADLSRKASVELENIKQANREKNAQKAQEARERLLKLKEEYDDLP